MLLKSGSMFRRPELSCLSCHALMGAGTLLHLHCSSWLLSGRTIAAGPWADVVTHERCSGWISYPRTESTAYAAGFDLAAAVQLQCRHPIWGEYASALLQAGVKHPKVGDVWQCAFGTRRGELHL